MPAGAESRKQLLQIQRFGWDGPKLDACLGSPCPIARQQRIRIDRPRPLGDAVHFAAGHHHVRRLTLLDPVLQQRERIEVGEARAAGAVVDAGDEKQPEEVLRLPRGRP